MSFHHVRYGVFSIAVFAALALLSACQEPDPTGDPELPTGPIDGFKVDTAALPVDLVWQNPTPQGNALLSLHFPTASIGYFVGRKGVILKTTDAGATFLAQGSGNGELNAVRFFDADHGIAVGEAGLILHTVDGGATWNSRTIGGLALKGLCLDGGTDAIAVGLGGSLLKSVDGGASWSLRNTGDAADLYDCDFLPGDSIRVAAVGSMRISGDDGATWSVHKNLNAGGGEIYKGLFLDMQGIGGGIVYARNWDNAFVSRDGGATWKAWLGGNWNPTAGGMAITQGRLLLVGVEGKVWTRNLDGVDPVWKEYQTSATSILRSVHFPTPDTGYTSSEEGDILRTVDGGLTWSACGTVVTRTDLAAIHMVSDRVGYAVGAGGAILKTLDGGKTWADLERPVPRDLAGVHFHTENVGCAVGAGGTALWTVDGGLHWTLTGTGTAETLTDVHLVDANIAYAAGGAALKTEDGGKTWTQVTGISANSHVLDYPDDLIFDGRRFHGAGDGFTLSYQLGYVFSITVRESRSAEWTNLYLPVRLPGSIKDYSGTGPSSKVFYAIQEGGVIRVDMEKHILAQGLFRTTRPLNDLSCPDARTCFAVGDFGTILKLVMP